MFGYAVVEAPRDVYTSLVLETRLFSGHLEDDETVSVVVHRHWIMGVRALAPPTISLLLALVFLSSARLPAVLYTVLTWALASLVWWARSFFDYYLDAWLITNMGVIDLEWHGVFHRQSSRVLYSDIEGVSYEVKGVAGTLLRYGDISVEKISTGTAISLTRVPHPRRVEAVILKNKEAYLHKKNMKDASHVQTLLATLVAEQIQLKGLPQAKTVEAPVAVQEALSKGKKKGFSSSKLGSRSQ